MMLTRERGEPTVAEVFAFMAGAVAAFALLGVIAGLTRSSPFEPGSDVPRHAGMLHFLAVGAALGTATLVALIHSAAAWPLGAFGATATYLAAVSAELTLLEARSRPRA